MQKILRCSLLAVLCAIPPAVAQQDSSQKALARAQYLLRQVNAEKSALETQKAELQKQVSELQAELKETAARAEVRESKLQSTLAGWKGEYSELRQEQSDTERALAGARAQSAHLEDQLQRQTGNFELCHAKNIQLYEINRELVQHYHDKSFWDALAQGEPVTGLKQVEVENLMQDYQFKLDDLNLSQNRHELQDVELPEHAGETAATKGEQP